MHLKNNFTPREEKIFCITYLEIKSLKIVQAKFHRKFNNYTQKSQIYRWVHKFQAIRSVNNLNYKAKNPRSGRKLTASCPNNMDMWEIQSEGVQKVPPMMFPRTWSFMCIIAKNLKKGSSAISIQNPDQHKLMRADTNFFVSVINHYHINGLHLFWDTLYNDLKMCFFLFGSGSDFFV